MSTTTPTPSTDPGAEFRHEWLELLRDELETISNSRIVAATYRTGPVLDETQAALDAEEHTCWCHLVEALTSRGGDPQ
jgi:hypothetical protein